MPLAYVLSLEILLIQQLPQLAFQERHSSRQLETGEAMLAQQHTSQLYLGAEAAAQLSLPSKRGGWLACTPPCMISGFEQQQAISA